MKKATTKSLKAEDDDMLREYDFSGAVRGKSYKPLHKGYSVKIHKEDGSTVVKHYKLLDGAIIEYYPEKTITIA